MLLRAVLFVLVHVTIIGAVISLGTDQGETTVAIASR
jgi:hypothetical protein